MSDRMIALAFLGNSWVQWWHIDNCLNFSSLHKNPAYAILVHSIRYACSVAIKVILSRGNAEFRPQFANWHTNQIKIDAEFEPGLLNLCWMCPFEERSVGV